MKFRGFYSFILLIDSIFIYYFIHITVTHYNEKCNRIYPNDNLLNIPNKQCNNYIYDDLYKCNLSSQFINFSKLINHYMLEKRMMLFTVIDDNSFKYLLNLYKIFFIPYRIESLITIIFYNYTMKKCIENNIFCIYQEWPLFLRNAANISLRKRLWFLKYYYIYTIVNHNISILFIDSDVLFIKNCMKDIVDRQEDVVMLKSQLPQKQTYGNSGILYIFFNFYLNRKIISSYRTIEMMKYGLNYIQRHISEGIKGYLSDQEVLTIALRKYKNITRGLYKLPLYTVGLPPENEINYVCAVHPIHCDKEFSLKERMLYYVDENQYYTSLLNKYALFTRSFLQKEKILAVKLCRDYNLTVILPDQNCIMPNCVYRMNNSFGALNLIKYFENNNISIRESISFLLYCVFCILYY